MTRMLPRLRRSATPIEPLESRIAPAAVLHLLSNSAGDGDAANGASSESALSADGKVLVFVSDAGNLVAGDTNQRRAMCL